MTPWTTRPELPSDAPSLHALIADAFPTAEEADLVDALRADPSAWIEGLSTVATDENAVVVLGHPDFYPRFGFEPASLAGITAPFDAPDDAFQAVALDSARPVPRGEISYPEAFGI